MTTQPTTTTKILLSDLPHHLIGEITRHLDPITIIKLLPESFHQPGDARAATAALQKALHEERVERDYITAENAVLQEDYVNMAAGSRQRGQYIQEQRERMERMRIGLLEARETSTRAWRDLREVRAELRDTQAKLNTVQGWRTYWEDRSKKQSQNMKLLVEVRKRNRKPGDQPGDQPGLEKEIEEAVAAGCARCGGWRGRTGTGRSRWGSGWEARRQTRRGDDCERTASRV